MRVIPNFEQVNVRHLVYNHTLFTSNRNLTIDVSVIGLPTDSCRFTIPAKIIERDIQGKKDKVLVPIKEGTPLQSLSIVGPFFNGTSCLIDGIESKVMDRFETTEAYELLSF